MQRLLFTALACLISVSAAGQGWEHTYGVINYSAGYEAQQTSDGGYIIAVSTTALQLFDHVYLIKTDGNGVEIWSQTYGGISHDYSKGLICPKQTYLDEHEVTNGEVCYWETLSGKRGTELESFYSQLLRTLSTEKSMTSVYEQCS